MAQLSTLDLLRREHARTRTLNVLYLLPLAGLGFGLPALAYGLIDLKVMLMEHTAFRLIVSAGGIGVLATIILLRKLRNRSKLKDLAKSVETRMPELMDALVCVCELSEQATPPSGPLHHALVERVNRVDPLRLQAAARENGPGLGRVIGAWTVLVAVLVWGHVLPLGEKFRNHTKDLLSGTSSGLTVSPGDADVAEGDEMIITATVHRGPKNRVMVVKVDDDQRYRMTEMDDGTFEFTFYSVTEPIRYRVTTPTLQSRVFTLSPYRKPALESIQIHVTPPDYTMVPARTSDTLTSISVQQGSRVTLTGKAIMPLTAYLINADNEQVVFAKGENDTHSLSMIVDASDTYQVVLEDGKGHKVPFGEPWDIEMIADLPPVIKIIDPAKETHVITEGADVSIAAEITDDYGTKTVTAVYNINGGGWKTQMLRADDLPALPLILIANNLETGSAGTIGDVILFYLEARDSAEPTPNVSRSGIRFVEVRPKKDDQDQDDQSDGKGKQKKEDTLRVGDLIIRTKAMIRDILSLSMIDDPTAKSDAIQNLAGKAADLHLDTNRRYMDIKKKADEQNMSLGKIGSWFVAAVEDMKTGHSHLTQHLLMEAISSEQSALANLIKIAIELEKNSKKKQGAGSGKQSSQTKQGKEKSPDQKNAEKEKRKALEAAQQMLADLRELIQEENQLRNRMEDLESVDPKDRKRDAEHVAKKQRDVAERTETLRERLSKQFPAAQEVGTDLDRAKLQMQNARRNVTASQPATAKKYAGNATKFLQRAQSGMERLRDSLANDRLRQAMNRLSTLQAKQGQVQGASQQLAKQGEVSREAAAQLAKNQQALGEEFEDLMRDLDKAGAELDEQNPGTEERMQSAIRSARENQVEANMKRAANALRYRRPGKAQGYQHQVQAALNKLAEQLEAIQRGQGKLSAEELSAMLQKTLKNMQALKESDRKEPEESRKAMIRELQKMAAQVGSKGLKQLSNTAQKLGESGADPSADAALAKVLASAANVLERELLKTVLRQKIRLSRSKGQQTPGEYRKLVEQYFKALSEDEEE